MTMCAQTGYTQMRKASASPRQIEAELLTAIASSLEVAADPENGSYTALANAIHRNAQLWTALLADLAMPENSLDDQLKAQLISLGAFSMRHGNKVLSKEEGCEPLIRINRSIAAGLRAAAENAEAA